MVFMTIAIDITTSTLNRRSCLCRGRLVSSSHLNLGTVQGEVDMLNIFPMPPPVNANIISRKTEEQCQSCNLKSQSGQGETCSSRIDTDGIARNPTARGL